MRRPGPSSSAADATSRQCSPPTASTPRCSARSSTTSPRRASTCCGTTALVYLASPGGLPMPVDLRLTLANGAVETVRLPVEIWYRSNRYAYARQVAADPVKVEIDPGMNLPDVRRENNVWVKK